MSRLPGLFRTLREAGKTGLVPFVTAGDPSFQGTVPLLHALVSAGADAIELGIPFSDPMADGPVIQRASERALGRGVTVRQILAWVQEFREKNQTTPIILMGYLNPVEAMGVERFAEAAAAAGADGVILVDLTPEESAHEVEVLRRFHLDPIFLLAPTSSPARVATVKRLGSGFVYYVSLRGITGGEQRDWDEVAQRTAQLRQELGMPVVVGFGIRDATVAGHLAASGCDAVVIGSALVERLSDARDDRHAQGIATEFLLSFREALGRRMGEGT